MRQEMSHPQTDYERPKFTEPVTETTTDEEAPPSSESDFVKRLADDIAYEFRGVDFSGVNLNELVLSIDPKNLESIETKDGRQIDWRAVTEKMAPRLRSINTKIIAMLLGAGLAVGHRQLHERSSPIEVTARSEATMENRLSNLTDEERSWVKSAELWLPGIRIESIELNAIDNSFEGSGMLKARIDTYGVPGGVTMELTDSSAAVSQENDISLRSQYDEAGRIAYARQSGLRALLSRLREHVSLNMYGNPERLVTRVELGKLEQRLVDSWMARHPGVQVAVTALANGLDESHAQDVRAAIQARVFSDDIKDTADYTVIGKSESGERYENLPNVGLDAKIDHPPLDFGLDPNRGYAALVDGLHNLEAELGKE